ncbi:uncharacterized protein LOC131853219 isoform X2 [Achroia grisella]|uniref:uncharacterized protein LOC131853219 isoform X2 n=1 Tax=Achroia grisella TaxID=688607 RepID=UPI0027D26BDE|nr:uncharacterized protein LOC131853219 isoform X2 [Achroia grisella]
MALYVCKCLNVTLESDKFQDNVDIEKLELSTSEQRDIFFSEKILSCPISSLKIKSTQQALLGLRTVGRWDIHTCLACNQSTYAVLKDKSNGPCVALIAKSTLTTIERVNALRKSNNFSPVFNLLVPEVTNDIEMKENIDTNNRMFSDNKVLPTQNMIGSLNKQLNQTLESQLEAIEDSVRQFRDQKYAEYEAYKDRAQRDHKILASIVCKARASTVDSDGWRVDTSLDNGPPSPQLPPLQRRRLSSFKDAKKVSQNIVKARNVPQEEDSLDAEDLFDLEGMDSRNNMISDHDDYDSDQGSNDEGIHIARRRPYAAGGDIAHSLPIDMPKFPDDRTTRREIDDDEEPQDIAASIKALARSVHGDVFELPRPRFSTQI